MDADDTAKALLALRLLGRPANADLMISKFRTNDGHLQTYVGERNSSFSANCNVLIALLHMCEPDQYVTEISTITTFLCESWWKGTTKDKWVSGQAVAFTDLILFVLEPLPSILYDASC